MATEVLHVPEDDLLHVISIIRNGLDSTPSAFVPKHVIEGLTTWCDEKEEYITS